VLHNHGLTTKMHLKNRQIDSIKFESECYYYRTYKRTPLMIIFIGRIFHCFLNIVKK